MPTNAQRQHILQFRKELQRKRMLRWALPGPVYVPFIGDGDLAVKFYADRQIYGADIDPHRVKTASARLKGDIREANCDEWPFPGVNVKFAMADFDAFSHPYPAFEAFWVNANKLDRVVMFFTDGHRQAILRLGVHVLPDGRTEYPANVYEKQPRNYFYLTDFAWPYVDETMGPEWRVLERMRYTRQTITYWACVAERVKGRVQPKPKRPPALYHGAPRMVPQGANQRVAVPASVRRKRAQREREKSNG